MVVAACAVVILIAPTAASGRRLATGIHGPGTPQIQTILEDASSDPSPPMNQPYFWAWRAFSRVNQPGPGGRPVWERWATDAETFPTCPDPDAPPEWPGDSGRNKNLGLRRSAITSGGPGLPLTWYVLENGAPTGIDIPAATEEIKRNQAGFDYIIHNGLYYQEGLASAFTRVEDAVDAVGGSPTAAAPAAASVVDFPMDAVEIKAHWVAIDLVPAGQRNEFYTNYTITQNDDGSETRTEYALISLHVMTKDLPGWFWATWLNKNVLGRCDFYGCRDDFGLESPYTPPNDLPNYPYPDGEVTDGVKTLLDAYEIDPVFQNYRVVGVQTAFVDPTGQPTLLSNTIAEQGFDQTGSCMSCHSRASVDSTGAPISVSSTTTSAKTPPTGDTTVTENGAPDPSWFWTSESPDDFFSSNTQITAVDAVQVDFVWGILNSASADGCSE